jgi:Zinc carboxypeptidase
MKFEFLFKKYKINTISGRYITLEKCLPILEKFSTKKELSIIGNSVLNQSIYAYQIGTGNFKIFLWSQMHGNEGTTTKALLDFIAFLNGTDYLSKKFLRYFTFYMLPMVNPDGATKYTRQNANNIDLNRDSQDLSQPESVVLRAYFNQIKPDFCFNLHDQRTIFGAGTSKHPATLSFLAPAYNQAREINETRLKAMQLIAAINGDLQTFIPNQIGRFDDSFNENCIGDAFQMNGVPTVLFEAGHFQNDYEREITRKYVFFSFLSAFEHLFENDIVLNKIDDYMKISQNNQIFYDFLYKNVKIYYDNKKNITNFAVQYKEELIDNDIQWQAHIAAVGDLKNHFGHIEFDAQNLDFFDGTEKYPVIGKKADFFIGNQAFENGKIKK